MFEREAEVRRVEGNGPLDVSDNVLHSMEAEDLCGRYRDTGTWLSGGGHEHAPVRLGDLPATPA